MTRRIERASPAHSLKRRLLLRAMVGAIFLPHIAYAEKAEPAGLVEDLTGEAFAEARAQRRQLQRAAPLFIDDVVGTGPASRLTLQLGKNTTLRVGSGARLTLDRLLVNAGGEITLQSGPILYDRPAGSAARMQIRSSFGLIAVRGTRFFAGPSAGVFGVFVERGSVSVSAAGSRVLLRAGQGTSIARPGAAPTPPASWRAQRIRTALESVR
jgi:hypothetical protein